MAGDNADGPFAAKRHHLHRCLQCLREDTAMASGTALAASPRPSGDEADGSYADNNDKEQSQAPKLDPTASIHVAECMTAAEASSGVGMSTATGHRGVRV